MAYLPCTLQGACHLGLQLHASNHTADERPVQSNDEDDYKEYPNKYHTIHNTWFKLYYKRLVPNNLL